MDTCVVKVMGKSLLLNHGNGKRTFPCIWPQTAFQSSWFEVFDQAPIFLSGPASFSVKCDIVYYLSIKRQHCWQRSLMWVAQCNVRETDAVLPEGRGMHNPLEPHSYGFLFYIFLLSLLQLWFILDQKAWLVYILSAEALYCGQRHWSFGGEWYRFIQRSSASLSTTPGWKHQYPLANQSYLSLSHQEHLV